MAERSATAGWKGSLLEGEGNFAVNSGAFEGKFSFGTRMGDEPGTNPEELLAASLASCFAMALNVTLEKAGTPATSVSTKAVVHFGKDDAGFAVRGIDLDVTAAVDGLDADQFKTIVDGVHCPISKALASVEIRRNSNLEKA